MSNQAKIKQTQEAKEEFNHPIVDILLERRTKEELQEILHCNERVARDAVSMCSMFYPVIAYSQKGCGYRRAKRIEDLKPLELVREYNDVERTIRDLNSRVKVLKKKMKPLIVWLKVAEKYLPQE